MSSVVAAALQKRAALALFGLLAVVGIGCLGCTPGWYTIPADSYAPNEVSDYDYLSEYGEWMHIPPFGMVWHPYVVAGWAPFCHGHWNWTYDGWAWISYEPFGWLVYHYGYWDYSPTVGWYWVPGSTWSPARVDWYTFGDYCGWAPMPPPGVYWPDPWQPFTVNVWVVVDINHFTDDNVYSRRIVEPVPRDIIRRHPVAKQPPTIRRLEEVTRRTIEPVRITRQPSGVRPDVIRSPQRTGRSRITTLKDMILPDTDKGKVEQYAPEVERKVLTPRKGTPVERQKVEQPAVKQRETGQREQSQQEQQQQQQEKKAQEKTKKKTERR